MDNANVILTNLITRFLAIPTILSVYFQQKPKDFVVLILRNFRIRRECDCADAFAKL